VSRHPPWIELAQFADDDNSYMLVRLLRSDGTVLAQMCAAQQSPGQGRSRHHGQYDLPSMDGTGLLRHVVSRSDPHRILFAILGVSNRGNPYILDVFAVESTADNKNVPSKHEVSAVIFSGPTHHASELAPLSYAIILWTLLELFGFDPDLHFTSSAALAMQIPSIVRDGALDRFRAEPAMQKLNTLLAQREQLKSLEGAELENKLESSDSDISRAGYRAVDALVRLHPYLNFDGVGGILEMDERSPNSRSFTWHLLINEDDEVEFNLILPEPISGVPSYWSVVSEELQAGLATDEDLISALQISNLVLEESAWDAWYGKHIAPVGNPTILLDIDIEPYLLLDAPTPYMWSNDAFITFLKQWGRL